MKRRNMTLGGLVLGLVTLSGCPINDANKVAEPKYEIETRTKVFVPPECKQVINAGLSITDTCYATEYITGKDAQGNIKTWYHYVYGDLSPTPSISNKWHVREYVSTPDLKVENVSDLKVSDSQ